MFESYCTYVHHSVNWSFRCVAFRKLPGNLTHTSKLRTSSACFWINSRRGSTWSPIRTRNRSSAARGVFHFDLQECAVGGVERGVAKFLGVHFAQAFKAGDLQAFFARAANSRRQTA